MDNIIGVLGGLSVFLLGVRFMVDYSTKLCVGKIKTLLQNGTKTNMGGVGCGVILSAITQSSVAINSALIGLVNDKTLTLKQACYIILGTNIGTTVTTQIISLTGLGVNMTLIGSLVAFIGIIFTFFKGKTCVIGYFLLGFGFIFIGLNLISTNATLIFNSPFINSIITTKNPALLLIYGFCVPAVLQSSSCLSVFMVVLAGQNLINFTQIAYLILGANAGSCVGVFFNLSGKNDYCKITAIFNLIINIFGIVIFVPLIVFAKDYLNAILNIFGSDMQRKIANFHTLYNFLSTVVILPLTKVFIKFSGIILAIFTNKKYKTIDKGKIIV